MKTRRKLKKQIRKKLRLSLLQRKAKIKSKSHRRLNLPSRKMHKRISLKWNKSILVSTLTNHTLVTTG